MIVLALGRLGFRPPCQWDTQRGMFINVLDGLFGELVDALPQASPQVRAGGWGRRDGTCRQAGCMCVPSSSPLPGRVPHFRIRSTASIPSPIFVALQEICSCLSGLGLLAYQPQPVALCKLLSHVRGSRTAALRGLENQTPSPAQPACRMSSCTINPVLRSWPGRTWPLLQMLPPSSACRSLPPQPPTAPAAARRQRLLQLPPHRAPLLAVLLQCCTCRAPGCSLNWRSTAAPSWWSW